jgi:hypothetical protein
MTPEPATDLMKGQPLAQQDNHATPPLLQDVRRAEWSQSTLSLRMALDYCILYASVNRCVPPAPVLDRA